MGIPRMTVNDPPSKDLEEHNNNPDDEGKRDVRNRLSEENQATINNDVNNKYIFQMQLPVPLRKQQQAPRPVVRWERFLPVKMLSVLLVENDDSTRQVVTALLQNCSYQVIAVAHGLEALKALEDPSNRIDLVLTEVVTPYLSGIGLLSKILSQKTFRSIPVIMMSSNDTMSIVFKCLSSGAVDFLVKPIRKNELKHIWQHVWRKSHTSSFSGSESGIMNRKPSSGSENINRAGNKNGSSAEDDNWSTDLNVNNGSDHGSDTQISWSKRVAEVDSQQPIIRLEQLEDPPRAHVQVTNSRSEPPTNNWGRGTATRERNEEGDKLVSMGKYLEMGIPINQDLQVEEQPNRKMQKIGVGKSQVPNSESKKDHEKFEKRVANLHTEAVDVELSKQYSDSVVVITNSTDPNMESATNEGEQCTNTNKAKTTAYITEPLCLELDLNSVREGDARPKNCDSKQKVLRHSDLSAFSRYNTASNINQAPTGNVGSCSPPENSSRLNLESNTDGTNNQCSNGSSNNDDMGSTTNNNIFSKQAAAFCDNKLPDAPTSGHLCSGFQSVKNINDESILPEIQEKTEAPTSFTQQQQVQVQHRHHYHHYHHHHHHHGNLSSMRNTTASASHFAPSKVLTSTTEGNAGNDVDEHNNMTQREVALHKFRQKRKDRCFDKKVRYQSRKRLAEERPRIKGQFVRQVGNEDKNDYPNS